MLFFQARLFLGIDHVNAIDFLDLGDVVKILGDHEAVIEFVHFDGVPRADLLVQPVLGLSADQLQLEALGHRIRRHRFTIAVKEAVVVLVKNFAGFFVLLNLGEIVAVAHLATYALVVVDKYPVRL